ncbi:MAG: protein-L-isoaspartate O-methyltransferase [Candidatus Nanoarchaeia archaeon]|nr:protein-L-isoaspartate O-methyltransferase [Candidatus Haiyanarchaeum thermophilum]MCW1303401.1 protein-L-isoaspartate O-methyltransferase [Candidatus Haiyanarchaeum thermophilum]MCW1303912.1 protein-L-isoaspartate O-methyltransferase [Candidatus Haiyanarchaeum thermophilum]MCW1306763.1 protein-L-isoaspartate O-methyltransferase [Candidatus Haiyanarchaeum thermophilum]MCW1307427.1 protein-L-isoaspartate O-methyltransferase [Candidatus Haiyanarchaeum thermophilum]
MEDFFERNKCLVEALKKEGLIKSRAVEQAFLNIPRHLFVPEELIDEAYVDSPLPIGSGQTISAPHMVAIMLELLELKRGQKVLEVGAGSGWNACLMAEIVGSSGKVYSIERIPEIAHFARKNVEKLGMKNVFIVVGDGTLGYPEEMPYDRIIVTAASPKIPKPLLDQLKGGGILILPLGDRYCQKLIKLKKDRKPKISEHGYCFFVPLIGKFGFTS